LADRESEARSLFTGAIFKRNAEVFDLEREREMRDAIRT
jgi:hypothetical protein